MSTTIEMLPSPNWSEKKASVEFDSVIIHYTAGGHYMSSARWLTMKEAQSSAHYVIGRNGQIVQLVSTDKCAWHAGRSQYRQYDGEPRDGANKYTIGIELANHGLLEKVDGRYYYRLGRALRDYKKPGEPVQATLTYPSSKQVRGWWEPFYDNQIDALKWLLGVLKDSGYGKAVENLQGHDEIAIPEGRKMDPGPVFPWEKFERKFARTVSST